MKKLNGISGATEFNTLKNNAQRNAYRNAVKWNELTDTERETARQTLTAQSPNPYRWELTNNEAARIWNEHNTSRAMAYAEGILGEPTTLTLYTHYSRNGNTTTTLEAYNEAGDKIATVRMRAFGGGYDKQRNSESRALTAVGYGADSGSRTAEQWAELFGDRVDTFIKWTGSNNMADIITVINAAE